MYANVKKPKHEKGHTRGYRYFVNMLGWKCNINSELSAAPKKLAQKSFYFFNLSTSHLSYLTGAGKMCEIWNNLAF